MMTKPRPEPRTEQAMKRLMSNPDFQTYMAHQHALLEYMKTLLVTTPVAALPEIQGRAKQLQENLQELKDLK
jgi:hypothetical protein